MGIGSPLFFTFLGGGMNVLAGDSRRERERGKGGIDRTESHGPLYLSFAPPCYSRLQYATAGFARVLSLANCTVFA